MNSKMKIIFGGILAATGIILLIVGLQSLEQERPMPSGRE